MKAGRLEMTRVRGGRIAAPLAMLIVSQPVFGQNSLDLKEADARSAAFTIMTAAEERFDCKFEEHSLRDIGNEPSVRYLFYVSVEGDECREALIFATNMAARDDKLMFRQIEHSSEQIDDQLILYDQVLIHEVNPEIDNNEDPEE
jgi:hypothetical protein